MECGFCGFPFRTYYGIKKLARAYQSTLPFTKTAIMDTSAQGTKIPSALEFIFLIHSVAQQFSFSF